MSVSRTPKNKRDPLERIADALERIANLYAPRGLSGLSSEAELSRAIYGKDEAAEEVQCYLDQKAEEEGTLRRPKKPKRASPESIGTDSGDGDGPS